MKKDGGQEDQKTIVYNDAFDDNKITDLNDYLVHLYNGQGDNVNNGNNKYNYIEQGGIINEQDEQGNHFGNANNNPQAQNKHFGGGNELNQNNTNNDDNNNDNNNKNQNQARNNNQVEISEDDQSYDDPNMYYDNSEDKQHNHDSARD